MKQKDIDWNEVEIIEDKALEFEDKALEFEDKSIILTFKIKYKIYKYTAADKPYYKRVIELPFAIQSDWTITAPVEKDIINLLKSKLRQKYKDILVRDYRNREYVKKFGDIIKVSDPIKNFSSDLHHKAYTDKINDIAVGNIWKELYPQDKYTFSEVKNTNYEKKLSWGMFIKMMIENKCAYCGVSIEQINNIKLFTKRSRGYTLEVDQINPYGNYTDKNCVACCYWCNNAKTDEFKVGEFKEIARGINKAWNQRLKDSDETIDFPENSAVWEPKKS